MHERRTMTQAEPNTSERNPDQPEPGDIRTNGREVGSLPDRAGSLPVQAPTPAMSHRPGGMPNDRRRPMEHRPNRRRRHGVPAAFRPGRTSTHGTTSAGLMT